MSEDSNKLINIIKLFIMSSNRVTIIPKNILKIIIIQKNNNFNNKKQIILKNDQKLIQKRENCDQKDQELRIISYYCEDEEIEWLNLMSKKHSTGGYCEDINFRKN